MTAIAFFILANVLFLAHAVVPHHHHNKQVCFENSHCQHDNFTDEPNTSQDNHSHDGEKNPDDCVFKGPVVILSNQLRADFKFINTTDRSGLDGFDHNLLNSGTKFQIQSLSFLIIKRVTDSSYPSFVSASLGLRAPPVV